MVKIVCVHVCLCVCMCVKFLFVVVLKHSCKFLDTSPFERQWLGSQDCLSPIDINRVTWK